MKEMWVVETKNLNDFTADDLIATGFKYQSGIAIPYTVGKSIKYSEIEQYSSLDKNLHELGFVDGEEIFIELSK